jgi:tRNA pseudouridine38-40 synthase
LGFQRQRKTARTVQAVLEQALRQLGWQAGSLRAAGRTDAGVHARGQVISYDLAWNRSTDRLSQAINAHLPSDVAIRSTERAPEGFHPRFSARRRRYSYRLLLSDRPDPMAERFAWRIWPAPESARVKGAARLFVGEHDFGAFGRPTRPGGSTVRRLWLAEWTGTGDQLVLVLEADAFLNRMVRRMVAAMVRAGLGDIELEQIEDRLRSPAGVWPGRLAPARGLCLESVLYPE